MSKGRSLKIALNPEHFAHLDRMAADAKVKPGALARSMLEALIDDDAKAHEVNKPSEGSGA